MKPSRLWIAFGIALYPFSYGLASQDERASSVSSVPGEEEINIHGNCTSSAVRSYDPRSFVFLKNRHVRWTRGNRTTEFKIDGERLWVYGRLNGEGEATRIPYQVDYIITGDVELDIEMDPVLLEGNLYVYWRETFRHRSYRQGLLEVTGMTINKVCEGNGGVDQGSPH